MKPGTAAERLGEILKLDAVGDLLDDVGDPETRDLVAKVIIRLRCIAVDAQSEAEKSS